MDIKEGARRKWGVSGVFPRFGGIFRFQTDERGYSNWRFLRS